MSKELPLKERIQKLFESGWVNEFNYLENQLQEARYLLACLDEKYTQLTNNWNELEEWLKKENEYSDYKDIIYRETMGYVLDKMKEIKEGK